MHCGTMMYRVILSGGKEEGCGWLSTRRCGAVSACVVGREGQGGAGGEEGRGLAMRSRVGLCTPPKCGRQGEAGGRRGKHSRCPSGEHTT